MVLVAPARTPEEFDAFRSLVREFADWAMGTFNPGATKLPPVLASMEQELAALPGKYAEPGGAMFVATVNGAVAGCVAGFRYDPHSLEVTRLWVRPTFRGHGVGEALVTRLLDAGQATGYRRAVLRSRKEMTSAHRIYRNAGFADADGPALFPTFNEVELAMVCDLTGAPNEASGS